MTQYTITANEWTAITEAGKAVSCWLDEDADGAVGSVDVRVTHSTEGVPVINPTVCKRIWSAGGNLDTVTLNPDNSRDVWYARCKNIGDSAIITVDHGLNNIHTVDTNAQSQVGPIFQFFMMSEDKTDITLSTTALKDDSIVHLTAGHGFTTGTPGYEDFLAIYEGEWFEQSMVISVSGNDVGLLVPLSRAYTTAAVIVRGKVNMSVDGSSVQKKFYFRPRVLTNPLDISTEMVVMAHSTVPDDGKFGGITALTNGLMYRRVNGDTESLGNYRSNQAFRDRGWVVEYPAKAPSGTYATEARMKRFEVFTHELRLDPRTSDYLEVTVRDAINAGSAITRLVVSILGSYTSGE